MPVKKRVLVISSVVLVFIAVILIFSPILRSKPIAIKPGEIYQDTITVDDPPGVADKNYRRHTYSLDVISEDKYTIEVRSLSDDVIIFSEYYEGEKKQLMETDSRGGSMTEYEIHSAGQKIFHIEALASDCPAEYWLKVTKL